MGGQTSSIPQGLHRQRLEYENKPPHDENNALRTEEPGQKVQFELRRDILTFLKQFRQDQLKFGCPKRIQILSLFIDRYDGQFEKDNLHEQNTNTLFSIYQQKYVLPLLKHHESLCFTCTGRHWEIRQWNIPEQQAFIEQGISYQIIKFTINNQEEVTDHLEVIIYKYLKPGDGYLKSDKVRNMKIFKKPLSELQLTNLIFNHQYLVVECENSYWSFQKDTKTLIVQASVLLADVRDKILGKKRIEEMSFTWLGLRPKWFPEVMYESNNIVARDISEVRVFAEHTIQTSLKYNVFKANCKIYAQYIMKKCITEQSWQKNRTFFDFFNK